MPEPVQTQRDGTTPRVVLLAHMIGDGSCVKRQPIRYASVDEENLAAVTDAAEHFGVTAVRDEYAAARVTTLRLPAPYRLTHGKRNPIAAWLDKLGLFGKRSYEKFVPAEVFALPNDQVALFLRHLWATDGSRALGREGQTGTDLLRVDEPPTCRRRHAAAAAVRHHRVASIRVRKAGYRDCWHLTSTAPRTRRRSCSDVDVHGAKWRRGARGAGRSWRRDRPQRERRHGSRRSLEHGPDALADKRMTHREFAAAMGTQVLRIDDVEALTEPLPTAPGRRGPRTIATP